MKRVLFLLITVLAITVVVISCKKDKENVYTVTFYSNDGSEVVAQTIAEGEKAAEPQPEPTREGYFFGGWYIDNPAFTNKWNFDTDVVTKNITLYAKWCTVKLLETITYYSYRYDETSDRYKFEYDEQNRITKISEYSNYTKTLTYEGDDLVRVVTSDNNGNVEMYEYTKSGNTITHIFTYSGSTYIPSFTNIYTIELDNKGLPVKQEVKRSDNVFHVYTYEYQDENLTKITITSTSPDFDWTDVENCTYSYDNEKSALYHCKTPKWYLIMELNNFGINNSVTYSGGTYPPRSSYTYEYDVTGFPVKRTCQTSGHMTYSEGIEYFTYITK